MWEHFTTKPLVDNRTFRRVADCPTPWPCFVIAVREEFLTSNKHDLQRMLKVINAKTKDFKDIPNIDEVLAKRYDQKDYGYQGMVEDYRMESTKFNSGRIE